MTSSIALRPRRQERIAHAVGRASRCALRHMSTQSARIMQDSE